MDSYLFKSRKYSTRLVFFCVMLALPLETQAQYFYVERFDTQLDGATSDSDNSPWTATQGSSGFLGVRADFQDMTAAYVGTEAVWSSGTINISGTVGISVDALEYSTSEVSDYVKIYYKLDGSVTEVNFGDFSGDFTSATAITTVSGSTVEIIVRFLSNAENQAIDNVVVRSSTTGSTLYSTASGDWDLGTTWSTASYGGSTCYCYPDSTSAVNIGNGNTVNLNVDAEVNAVTIENTGILQYTAGDVELNMMSDGVFTVNSGGNFSENGQSRADLDFETGTGTSQVVIHSGGTFSIGRMYMFGEHTLNINGNGDLNLSDSFNLRDTCTVVNDLTGAFNIGGDFTINTGQASFTNNGTIDLTGDLIQAIYGGIYDGNVITNSSSSIFTIGGAVNPAHGDLTINNSGVINQYGNFTNIDAGSSFNNLGGSTWAWYYVGVYDPDVINIFSAGGIFEYEGFGNQEIIPLAYNNLTIDGSGTKVLQASTSVSGVMYMTNAFVSLGNYDLTIGNTGRVSNASSARFIITDGTGRLVQSGIGTGGRTGDIVFPVGVNSTSYTPVTVSNAGTADNFSVRVCSGIYEEGSCSTGTVASMDVIDRTWFISEAVAGGSNATLTLQWNASNELTGFDRTDVNVVHHNGSYWGTIIAHVAASGSGPYTASASGVTSFSPFGIEDASATPLPVELLSFTANDQDKKVLLQWETASELNNDFFTVEKTVDLITYQTIAKVEGHGTSEEKHRYNVFDYSALAGTSYYRLKQTDFDGTVSYSKLLRIDRSSVPSPVQVALYPVPSNGKLINVSLTGRTNTTPISVVVTDLNGRVLYRQELVEGKHQLTFEHKLSPGIYILKAATRQPVSRYFVVE